MKVSWVDGKREPQRPSNPRYPNGVDLDCSDGAVQTCTVALASPAPRIGSYVVYCEKCDLRMVVTTAGRRDDPRSVKVACKRVFQ